MQTFTDDEFKRKVQAETGIRPPWAVESFSDVEAEIRQCIARLRASPFLPRKESLRGFVYDVETGKLDEVPAAD